MHILLTSKFIAHGLNIMC